MSLVLQVSRRFYYGAHKYTHIFFYRKIANFIRYIRLNSLRIKKKNKINIIKYASKIYVVTKIKKKNASSIRLVFYV